MVRLRCFFILSLISILVLSGCVSIVQCDSTVKKVYSTDFETVTKKNEVTLDMGIENLFVFSDSTATMFMDDGSMRPNSPTPHSGNRMVGLEITGGHRNEFNLMNMQNLVQKELFISVWLYLPSDFHMQMSKTNWFEIANPVITAETFSPYFALHINQKTEHPDFGLQLYYRDVNRDPYVLRDIPRIDLQRGRWFNLQYYIYHDSTEGVIKIWFDDPMMQNQPIINVDGIAMSNPDSSAWYTTIAKIYHDPDDTHSPYRLWVDDLEVWNGMPPQRLSIDVWTDKGNNNELPISGGCLGSYKEGDTVSFYYSVSKACQGKLEVIDSAGAIKTLANGPFSQGTSSLSLQLKGPTGYWQAKGSVMTDTESNTDNFQFCIVQDYVKFRGALIDSSDLAANGKFYQVKVIDVMSDPTGEIQVDETIMVHWNYSLAKVGNSLDDGSYVEIFGGYVSTNIGGFSEAVILANPDDYIEWVVTYPVSVDPNGGRAYIDDASEPITEESTYNWLDRSVHKLYVVPAFESSEGRFIFSGWNDGNKENPRNVSVNGIGKYVASWAPAVDPVSISVVSPSNTTFPTDEVDLTLSIDAPVRRISYSLNGADNVSIAGNTTLRGLPNGLHSIIVYAEDYFGDIVSSNTIYFTVDTEAVSNEWIIGVVVAVIAIIGVIVGVFVFKKLRREKVFS